MARAEGELVYHALGTGEYDELARTLCPLPVAGRNIQLLLELNYQHALTSTVKMIAHQHSVAGHFQYFVVMSLTPYPFCHAVAETLRFIAVALHDVLRKTPSEALLLDNYARMCIILSEIINEVRHTCFLYTTFLISLSP